MPHELQRSKSDTFYEFYNYAFKEQNNNLKNKQVRHESQHYIYSSNSVSMN